MTRQIRWLGPENCEAVFAVLGWEHPDEELDHTRIRGLGPGGDQEASWGDLLVQDPATEVWSVVPANVVQVPREALDDLIRVAEYVSYGRRAVDNQPDGAPYPDAAARRALGTLGEHGLLGTRCTCSTYPAPHAEACAITAGLPHPVACACGDGSGVPHPHPDWLDSSPRVLSAQQAHDGRHCEIRQQRGGDA